ncbi:GtrA family protein [Vreelandella sp. EE27]
MTNISTATELGQVLRFGAIGLAATLTHLLVGVVSVTLWSGLHEFAANALAYMIAFTVSLIGHQRITFRRNAKLWRFCVMSFLGFAINNLALSGALAIGLKGGFAIAPAVIVAAGISYVLSRYWVFKH